MSQLALDEDGEVVGELTHVSCPRCGAEIVYNGNYFCRLWAYPFTGGPDECDWALSHDDATGDPVGDVDRLTWRQLCASYAPLREYLLQHPEED